MRSLLKYYWNCCWCRPDRATASQHAMRDLRETDPHPYYWAAFNLLGNCQNLKDGWHLNLSSLTTRKVLGRNPYGRIYFLWRGVPYFLVVMSKARQKNEAL